MIKLPALKGQEYRTEYKSDLLFWWDRFCDRFQRDALLRLTRQDGIGLGIRRALI